MRSSLSILLTSVVALASAQTSYVTETTTVTSCTAGATCTSASPSTVSVTQYTTVTSCTQGATCTPTLTSNPTFVASSGLYTTTTEAKVAYVTYVPSATSFTVNGVIYTATGATSITIPAYTVTTVVPCASGSMTAVNNGTVAVPSAPVAFTGGAARLGGQVMALLGLGMAALV